MSGRVLARLDDIKAWFRSGYRTQEVLEMLDGEFINVTIKGVIVYKKGPPLVLIY